MNRLTLCTAAALLSALPHTKAAESTALTLYNQNFAVVRQNIPLELESGSTSLRYSDVTAQLEPDSVVLRDPAGKIALQILEQNYRNDPVSQPLLLSLYEGQSIDFRLPLANGEAKIVSGKIIRSGYTPPRLDPYGNPIYNPMPAQPLIEVDGKLQFSLPGEPLFPALKEETILKPTLTWKIHSPAATKLDAELAYITGGMTWEASYNVVSPEESDTLSVIGWITMKNESGKTFENAQIKLMAGDVSKIQPQPGLLKATSGWASSAMVAPAPEVTEKSFDEYHLYSLPLATTLRDQETKQVEFINATGVNSRRLYVYDGMKLDWNQYRGYGMENIRQNENLGTEQNTKVAVVREFKNSKENHLGLPLPKGRVRFYRQDTADNRLEFTGENTIDHTPRDETVRIFTGNAFDIVGERVRTDFKIDTTRKTIDESFEIKLRNRKKEAVEVVITEHLFRWFTWEITAKSDPFVKTAAQVMEFRVKVAPDEEKTVTYTVRYTW